MRSLLTVIALAALATCVAAAGPITKIKDLCLRTTLVDNGRPAAVIVVPADGRYKQDAERLRARVRALSGAELPVLTDDRVEAKEQLKTSHVITLGNMGTNRFIRTLYRQWYTFLDGWYPGPGGSVVRSLHDPYGTKRNVVFLGGSDDAGVRQAVDDFAKSLRKGRTVGVGRLMSIRLGKGMKPPKVGETVYGWRDSYRLRPDGARIGYPPAGTFGWHPISVQAALYYMTGRKEYVEELKRLVFYAPGKAPKTIRTCSAYYKMDHPLVENYHYHAHTFPLLWDLIEESPLFTDAERLRITNELVAQQKWYTGGRWRYRTRGTSRHGSYHMLTIHTVSRYLAKSYPNPRWDEHLAKVDEAFAWWLRNQTWGERDTLRWVSTSMEPIFDYFMLTRPEAFVRSGAARRMIGALEILWTGEPYDYGNYCQTINLMRKAGHMLKDGRYEWLARGAKYDFRVFRIGQSWQPTPDVKVAPPEDSVGRVSVQPLPESRWRELGKPFPDPKDGFHFLSFRTGLGDKDDYLMLDGFYGRGRHDYHVNALYHMRIGGTVLAKGYANQVAVRRNGMVDPVVARAAALQDAVALDDVAFVKSVVPRGPFCEYGRRVLWRKGTYALVVDTVRAKESGEFEVSCQWGIRRRVSGPLYERVGRSSVFQTVSKPYVTIHPANDIATEVPFPTKLQQTWSGRIEQGESHALANLLYPTRERGKLAHVMRRHSRRSFVITGKAPAFFAAGPLRALAVQSDADSLYASPEWLVATRARSVRFSGTVSLKADKPVSLAWDLARGRVRFVAKEGATVSLARAGGPCRLDGEPADAARLRLPKGESLLTGAVAAKAGEVLRRLIPALGPHEAFAGQDKLLRRLIAEATPARSEFAGVPPCRPAWTAQLPKGVTRLAAASDAIVAATGKEVGFIDAGGRVLKRTPCGAEVTALCLHAPRGKLRDVWVGLDDDTLLALTADGRIRWRGKAQIDPSFRVGDRYQAPWFTDPKRKRGVLSLLVTDATGDGRPDLLLGRATTLEVRKLTGELIKRMPVKWGDITCLADLTRPAPKDRIGPCVVIGQWFTGSDSARVIDRKLRLHGRAYRARGKATPMGAWMQRGISHVRVADLDGDGAQEVVIGRNGHWNDVRVFDSTAALRWGRYFGPAERRRAWSKRFLRDVLVADLDGDGKREVIVATRNRWVCAFGHDGKTLWTRRFPNDRPDVMAMTTRGLAIGFGSGVVRWLDRKEGGPRVYIRLRGAVTALEPFGDGVVAATAKGQVALLKGEAEARRKTR